MGESPGGTSGSHSIRNRAFVDTRSTIGPGMTSVTRIPGKRVDSVPVSQPGEGSDFIVTIPQFRMAPGSLSAATAPAPEATREAATVGSTGHHHGTLTLTEVPAEIPDDRNNLAPGDKVLLIVEDDTLFAGSLLEFTRKKGYKGIVAVSGDAAIRMARRFLPIGILLDIQLPIMDGYEATRRIKGDPTLTHVPVIAVTSNALSGDEAKARAAGCDDFVPKPYSPRQLLAKIRQLLR